MATIVIENLQKSYPVQGGALPVLRGASARIESGTFAALCGPSGCGKSTLLLIAGSLLTPDSGRVILGGEDLLALGPARRGRRRAELVGIVFQDAHLLPYLSVEENIRSAALALPRRLRGEGGAGELMERLAIAPRRHHLPGQLSAGERQRAALARALYNRPRILLADEPTGNLDTASAEAVLEVLSRFAAAGGTVLMVTHNPRAAGRAGARWSLRDGTLIEGA